MRRISAVWFAFLLFAATSSTLSAQQSIYMLVDPIKGVEPGPHSGEFKLNSFSSASANSMSIGSVTSRATGGKATFPPVKVSMRFQPVSSASFYESVAAGTRLPSIEIRLYNTSNRMFYKTVFENVFLTNVATEASDEALQQIEFVYSRARWFASPDAAGLNAPVQVGCWDLTLAKSC
jgi:type VI protein secretion system component Hcp